MTCELMNFVIAFAPLFSKPVFKRVKVLLEGAILSPHIRTVANALRVMGLSDEKHFPNFVKCVPRGLRWLSFMVLTEVAFAKKVWALPFLTVLCPSERYDEQRGIRHRKLTDRARQAILLIKRWLPNLDLVFVGDSSFAAPYLLNAVREKVTVVSKLRLDAALYRKARARRKGQLGRTRKKGTRLPKLSAVIADPQTRMEKAADEKLVWRAASRN